VRPARHLFVEISIMAIQNQLEKTGKGGVGERKREIDGERERERGRGRKGEKEKRRKGEREKGRKGERERERNPEITRGVSCVQSEGEKRGKRGGETCRSRMGFQSCSTKITVSAPVRFSPRPPTWVVSINTSIVGSPLNSCDQWFRGLGCRAGLGLRV
jgi:hypothetical protein